MTHLNRTELVEYLDGELPGPRRAHLDACPTCRAEAETLGAVLEDVRTDCVPEPSPLFWDHFSARVHEAITRAEPEPAGWSMLSWRRAVAGAVAATALIALAWAVVRIVPGHLTPSGQLAGTTTAIEEPILPLDSGVEGEAHWTLVLALSEDLDWDAAAEAGLNVRPGAAERALLELSPEERLELDRLLRAELGEPNS